IKNKIFENKDAGSDLESIAINRMFEIGKNNDNYTLVAVFLKDKIVAFCIDEILSDGYSIRHYMKADTTHKGIYSFLVSEDSKVLINRGSRYCNIEQDLGLRNLRQSKKSFNPYTFLKKYTVSKRVDR
ncbi:MAG: phosphatidylglycerol lysyltransferase domain-containing protein, partial [Minisyncoccota bacterium]